MNPETCDDVGGMNEYRGFRAVPGSMSWFAKEYDPVLIGSIIGADVEPHDHGIVRALAANCRFRDWDECFG